MPTSVMLLQVTAAHPQPPRAHRSLSGVTGLRVLLGAGPQAGLESSLSDCFLSSEKRLQSGNLNLWFYHLTVDYVHEA